jgi:hypothetical protein
MMADDVLEILTGAKARAVPWPEIARALQRGDRNSRSSMASPAIKHAADLSGYTANVLRRMRSALSYADWLLDQGRIDDTSPLLQHSYNAVEILRRIEDVSRAEADALLPALLFGGISTAELKRRYEVIAGGADDRLDDRKVAMRRLHQFSRACERLVKADCDRLALGSSATFRRPTARFAGAAPDYILVGPRLRHVDGVVIRFAAEKMGDAAIDLNVWALAYQATFFRLLWVLVPASHGLAEAYVRKFDRLNEATIGVAEVAMENEPSLKTVRPPTLRAETKRRTGNHQDILIDELSERAS